MSSFTIIMWMVLMFYLIIILNTVLAVTCWKSVTTINQSTYVLLNFHKIALFSCAVRHDHRISTCDKNLVARNAPRNKTIFTKQVRQCRKNSILCTGLK